MSIANCPTCNASLPAGHPVLLMPDLEEKMHEMVSGWKYPEEGDPVTVGQWRGTVVKFSAGPGDGDYNQGATFDTELVVKIAGAFFRKVGTADSYGDVRWERQIRLVKAKEKTVTVYEFEW